MSGIKGAKREVFKNGREKTEQTEDSGILCDSKKERLDKLETEGNRKGLTIVQICGQLFFYCLSQNSTESQHINSRLFSDRSRNHFFAFQRYSRLEDL